MGLGAVWNAGLGERSNNTSMRELDNTINKSPLPAVVMLQVRCPELSMPGSMRDSFMRLCSICSCRSDIGEVAVAGVLARSGSASVCAVWHLKALEYLLVRGQGRSQLCRLQHAGSSLAQKLL
ncbi:hypothetical protein KC19_VG330600 [Ceratodon purpureus]|uniref:Uncharacterized protein n=1 Tax=Ceratodon purpureus TaxID=3225 RepID=A0A8T0HW29_CERPU|nr:hypothetical protein KC19_VG330600 [Ceratodon purpureus]